MQRLTGGCSLHMLPSVVIAHSLVDVRGGGVNSRDREPVEYGHPVATLEEGQGGRETEATTTDDDDVSRGGKGGRRHGWSRNDLR